MKSKQINFYMMPEDVAELDEYIKQQGLKIISSRSENVNIKELYSLNDSGSFKSYLIIKGTEKDVRLNYYNEIGLYVVDETLSPVIEFRISKYLSKENKFNRGRLFYNSEMMDEKGNLIQKDENLNRIADKLFRWYKQHFKDAKLNPNYTTVRTANWALSNNVTFAIN